MVIETPTYEKLVSLLRSPPDYIIVYRFRGVHAYLSNALRLPDLRGRNAMLILLRKLVALVLQDVARGWCGYASILRCGGNAIYIALRCRERHAVDEVYSLARKLARLLAAVLAPITIQVELLKVQRSNGRVELTLKAYDVLQPDTRVVTTSLYVENMRVDTRVMCPVCSSTGIGVDSSIHRSRVVRHIVREDERLCILDFMFRFVGRGFNSPGVVTLFVPELKVTLLKPDTAEAVFSLGNDVELRVSFIRHLGKGESSKCVGSLDDIVVVSLSLGRSTYTAVVIGLAPRVAEKLLRGVRDELGRLLGTCGCKAKTAGEFAEAIHNHILSNKKLIDKLLGSVRDIVARYICECDLRDAPQRFRLVLEPLRRFCGELVKGLTIVPVKTLEGREQSERIRAYVDLETTFVNLEGRHPILDLDTVQLMSESNYVAFIRSDGDQFGRLTSILRVAQMARSLEAGISRELLEAIEGLLKESGHKLEEVIDKLDEFEHRLLETYVWDSTIDAWLDILVRPTLLVQGLLGSTLVIYMGGDENLLVKPVVSCGEGEPSRRLCNLLHTVLVIRNLVLTAGAEAIATLVRGKRRTQDTSVIRDAIDLLVRAKVATASAGVLLVRPKFPAYTAVTLLDELVEAAKECGRDNTLMAVVQTTSGLLDVNTLVNTSILAPLPNEHDSKLNLVDVARLLDYVWRHPELADIEKLVWSYTFHSRAGYEYFADTADKVLEVIPSMHADGGVYIAVCRAIERKCALAEKCPRHVKLALYNTLKLIEKGV